MGFQRDIGYVISEPGLKIKLPWQQVRYFDKRLLVWDGDVTQIPTLGREFILVDTTARWRIADLLLFLTSVRDDVNLEMQPKLGRELLEQEILARAQDSMPRLGIELDDVRIKRVNYIDSVRKQVESRMIAERQSIAERFCSEGMGRSQEILGNMERDHRCIRSELAREAEEIRGKADAEATRIYGEAFGADPEFYSFFRTLESYRALGRNSTIMLSADSDFFRYLEESQAQD